MAHLGPPCAWRSLWLFSRDRRLPVLLSARINNHRLDSTKALLPSRNALWRWVGRAFYASISTAVLRACRVPACTTHRSISARRAAAAYIVAVASILFTCKLKSTTQPASVALRSWLLLLVAQPPRSLRGGASRPSCCGTICAPWATGGAGAGARSHAGGAALEKRPPPRGIAGPRQRRLWRKRLPARCALCAPGDQAGAQGTRKNHQTQA